MGKERVNKVKSRKKLWLFVSIILVVLVFSGVLLVNYLFFNKVDVGTVRINIINVSIDDLKHDLESNFKYDKIRFKSSSLLEVFWSSSFLEELMLKSGRSLEDLESEAAENMKEMSASNDLFTGILIDIQNEPVGGIIVLKSNNVDFTLNSRINNRYEITVIDRTGVTKKLETIVIDGVSVVTKTQETSTWSGKEWQSVLENRFLFNIQDVVFDVQLISPYEQYGVSIVKSYINKYE
ncbi:hypothetical protein HQ533_03670 [Candidatus Woesearchaeota archaeon]|nr:hypothetical protein [Candidatus Woesearchaeota archaeon]